MSPFFQNHPYNTADMAGRPPITPSTECGARLASLRKTAGLSQSQLAEAVGIPQRTVSFYERKANSIPSQLLPRFSQALDVPVEVILGLEVESNGKGKRGPKSDLERRFERIRQLPRKDQKIVIEVLDRFIGSEANRAS